MLPLTVVIVIGVPPSFKRPARARRVCSPNRLERQILDLDRSVGVIRFEVGVHVGWNGEID